MDVGPPILHLGFNQDASCFSIATSQGFAIFNSDPLKERFRRNFDGGLGRVEMLFKCNILAFVGGGTDPLYAKNKVMMWDDYKAKCFAELEFRSEVLNVRLRRDKIAVVVLKMVYVYNFADLSLVSKHDTHSNPFGLCAFSADHSNTVLACPGIKPGHVRIDLFDINKTHVIAAHTGELTQLVLNAEGTLLATASEKGTLVRVWDTTTGAKVREFRRGTVSATIYSIAFSRNSKYLVVGSDKGTVHVYALYDAVKPPQDGVDSSNNSSLAGITTGTVSAEAPSSVGVTSAHSNVVFNNNNVEVVEEHVTAAGADGMQGPDAVKNKQSKLSFMKDILPGYFSSEWSFASFTVETPDPSKKFYCAFGADDSTILVLCENGTYFKYLLRAEQARIVQIGHASFR